MDVIERVMILVREVGEESQLQSEVLNSLGPTSSFVRELGLDSLAKVELIDRAESSFGVILPSETFSLINTPLDLAQQIEEAIRKGKLSFRVHEKTQKVKQKEVAAPVAAATLLDVLEWHCDLNPKRTHIQFYQDDGLGLSINYGELQEKSRCMASGLSAIGVRPGDRVAIMLPTCEDYFYCFIGALILGSIPVPVYPPLRKDQLREHVERHGKILNNAGVSALIATKDIKLMSHYLESRVKSVQWVGTPDELFEKRADFMPLSAHPDDVALIQYTSGSTGDPKGVVLTHRELLSNIRAMGRALRATSADVVVSWLPLYHDMGLIGCWLGSLYYGAQLILMSPIDFITRPLRWPWAIHRHGGTISSAPNFAFDLCLKRANATELNGLDLSSWRVAMNGSEPVSADTLLRFRDYFSNYGLKEAALMPVYGLAENSVGLTFPPLDRGPLIKTINRELLLKKSEVEEQDSGMQVVSNGVPLPGHEIRIVDEQGQKVEEGIVGEIEFHGPSNTQGYFNAPEKTKDLFHDGWPVTGDLGFISDGELYITGRKKDIIIKAGRNIAPQELEEKVGDLEGVRKGSVVAFAVTDSKRGTERLVIAAEVKSTDQKLNKNLIRKINSLTSSLLDTGPDEVLLLPAHSVLKTSSGKIRRSACKEAYLEGILGKLERKELVVWRARLYFTVIGQSILKRSKKTFNGAVRFIYDCYIVLLAGIFLIPTALWIKFAPFEKKWKGITHVVRAFLKLSGIKLEMQGIANLPKKEEPCIFVANHNSYIDSVIMAAMLGRPLAFVAKRELMRNLFFKFILPPLDTVFVDRDYSIRSIEQLNEAQRLQQSKNLSLLFFPEGTFSGGNKLLRFHMGAFVAAAATGLPVVPITIEGTSRIFGGELFFPRPRNKIRIAIGAPIGAPKKVKEETNWQAARFLRDQAREEIMRGMGALVIIFHFLICPSSTLP